MNLNIIILYMCRSHWWLFITVTKVKVLLQGTGRPESFRTQLFLLLGPPCGLKELSSGFMVLCNAFILRVFKFPVSVLP